MLTKLSSTWEIMQASLSVLKRDKALIFFPLFSLIACLAVIASFAVPFLLVNLPAWKNSTGPLAAEQRILGVALLFAFYFVSYFVITFFNVGLIACAVQRMAGGDPTFAGGIKAAFSRIHLIAGWALVSATMGTILKIIESHKLIGRIVATVLGAAWTITTFLVVPVLVVENKGPIDALKESLSLLKKTWGPQVAGNFSFGLIFFLLFLPAFAAIAFGISVMTAGSSLLGLLILGSAVTYIIVLALIQSALHSIFQAALYMYTQGVTDQTGAFPVILLRDAMYAK